jgi:hypothetical protein
LRQIPEWEGAGRHEANTLLFMDEKDKPPRRESRIFVLWCRLCEGKASGRKQLFFFEKKEPKKLLFICRFRRRGTCVATRRNQGKKSFLLLFFKKEDACLAFSGFPIGRSKAKKWPVDGAPLAVGPSTHDLHQQAKICPP